jgi:hypothetical protein
MAGGDLESTRLEHQINLSGMMGKSRTTRVSFSL